LAAPGTGIKRAQPLLCQGGGRPSSRIILENRSMRTTHEQPDGAAPGGPTRRHLLKALAALGVGSAVFQRALAVDPREAGAVTPEMVQQAEWIAGLKLTDEQRKELAGGLTQALRDFETLRAVPLPNHVPPALSFHPAPWAPPPDDRRRGAVQPTSDAAPK